MSVFMYGDMVSKQIEAVNHTYCSTCGRRMRTVCVPDGYNENTGEPMVRVMAVCSAYGIHRFFRVHDTYHVVTLKLSEYKRAINEY